MSEKNIGKDSDAECVIQARNFYVRDDTFF